MHFTIDKKCKSGTMGAEGGECMTLREARSRCHLTQAQASAMLGVSLRSYKAYETDPRKADSIKYRYLLQQLETRCLVDERHGILTPEEIRSACAQVLKDYPITYCWLFGSYAKGTATAESDVDLLVSGEVEGLRFYGLVDALQAALHKRTDVLTPAQLTLNPELLNEILKEGVRVYG